MKYIISSLLLTLSFTIHSQSFKWQEVRSTDFHESLHTELKSFAIYSLDLSTFNETLHSNPIFSSNWDLPGTINENISIKRYKIFSDDYILQTASNQQFDPQRSKPMVFRGVFDQDSKSEIRLTINKGFIAGTFILHDEVYFIDQVSNYNKQAPSDYVVVYRASEVIQNEDRICGSDKLEDFKGETGEIGNQTLSAGACKGVEIALATDWKLYQEQGSTQAVEDEVTNILNNVQNNFDNEFNDELEYQIVTIWVSDCNTCDNWRNDLFSL